MHLKSILSRVKEETLDLLLPPACVGCRKEGAFLCQACEDALPRLQQPYCQRCAQPLGSGDLCQRCQDTPLAIDGIRSPFLMEGAAREMVHRLKYNDLRALAPVMARLLSDYATANPVEADYLASVPLHSKRERQRGYNQSRLLAAELGKRLGLPVLEGLARQKDSPPQARSSDAQQRRANVEGAFVYRGPSLQGRRVLLVDDVTTTGATLEACAVVLREAGASSTWGLTVAREA